MVKATIVFLAGALVSAIFQLSFWSCGHDPSCGCPVQPMFPDERSALPITLAQNYNAMGNADPLPFDASGSSIEIVGQQVVLRYTANMIENHATYSILPASLLP